MAKEYMKMREDGTYDLEAIKKAAMEEAARINAKQEAEELYKKTVEEQLKKKREADEVYEETLEKHKKKKKKGSKESSSKLKNFLNDFGDWSRNVQDHFDREYGPR